MFFHVILAPSQLICKGTSHIGRIRRSHIDIHTALPQHKSIGGDGCGNFSARDLRQSSCVKQSTSILCIISQTFQPLRRRIDGGHFSRNRHIDICCGDHCFDSLTRSRNVCATLSSMPPPVHWWRHSVFVLPRLMHRPHLLHPQRVCRSSQQYIRRPPHHRHSPEIIQNSLQEPLPHHRIFLHDIWLHHNSSSVRHSLRSPSCGLISHSLRNSLTHYGGTERHPLGKLINTLRED